MKIASIMIILFISYNNNIFSRLLKPTGKQFEFRENFLENVRSWLFDILIFLVLNDLEAWLLLCRNFVKVSN